MKSIAFFQFSTEEDLSFVLEFSGLVLSGRDFEIKITERASNTTKATLTNGDGITITGANILEVAYAKAGMTGWARGEYSADVIDVTGGGHSRIMAVRFDYNLPGRLVQGVQDRKAYISWSPNQAVVTSTGAIGPKGAKGDKGDQGDQGEQGDTGPSGTVAVGDVTTGAPGSDASVTNVGTSTAAIFDFAIPAGAQGIQGVAGNKGWSPSFAVVTDGTRRVLQVDDWAGGEGTKPATGDYVGASGLTPTIGDAVDIRGPAGTATIVDGDKGDITTSAAGDTWTLNDGAVDLDKLASSVYADQPVSEGGTDTEFLMHSLGVKQSVTVNAEQADFTPQSPFIAKRPLGEKIGEVISIRDLGAPTMSGGQPDYTSVLVSQEANLAYKTVKINEPVIRLTGLSLEVDNLKLVGKGKTQTVIYNPDDTDTLTLHNNSFPEISALSFQHAPAATAGRGLVCTGATSSGNFHDLFIAANPDGGIHFDGGMTEQSSNRVENCLFSNNGAEQLLLVNSNDFRIISNDFGKFGAGDYPPRGAKFTNSGAGTYAFNKHWDNVVAAEFDGCSFMRVVNNRFEESQNEGVLISGGFDNTILGNHLHTNSKSSSGTYSALKLAGAAKVSILGNRVYSWDAATYKHKHGVEADNSSSILLISGNSIEDVVSAAINTNSATQVRRIGNEGSVEAAFWSSLGTEAQEVLLDLNNPATADYSAVRELFRVAGAPRGEVQFSRYGSGSGGQYILKTADSSGVLQNRIIIDQFGQIFLSLPTSAGASGSLWNDGGTVKVSP